MAELYRCFTYRDGWCWQRAYENWMSVMHFLVHCPDLPLMNAMEPRPRAYKGSLIIHPSAAALLILLLNHTYSLALFSKMARASENLLLKKQFIPFNISSSTWNVTIMLACWHCTDAYQTFLVLWESNGSVWLCWNQCWREESHLKWMW